MYCLDKEISRDSTGKEVQKIVSIFFWNPQSVEFSRRFTSNSLLIIDATFRTNRKGLPLIIAVSKSNTERTFPVAFCWVPEESAEAYTFFYRCLREEIYKSVPDLAIVLIDLSAGITKAYNKLKCLPNSQL